MKHFYNNGKEYLRTSENQGKSDNQMRASYIGAFIGFVGMFIMILIAMFN